MDKVKGIQKLEDALKIVEKVIKQKQGTFKLVNKPTIIGAKDDKDIEDIMSKINDDNDGSSAEEDNEEGMDIDLEDDDDEETKQDKKKSKKKTKKQESDEDDS